MSWTKDHEFPWIEVNMETREMKCKCGGTGTTDNWLSFLGQHKCCEKEPVEKETTSI